MQQEYLALSKRLRALPLNVAGSVLQQLSTEFQLRQDETKNAISEFQHQEAVRREHEAAEAQKKLEAEQKAIAEANRPKLAAVGAPVQ